MLRSFWQNLGMTYKDIQELPTYTTDMLIEIMKFEKQYEMSDTKSQTNKKYGQNNLNRIKGRR